VSWATAVQAKSFSIGLLKNVSTAVGSDCPRQEAAQIIYNALNMDLLEENALGVKVPSGETILTKYLNGYTATVVVTGNEYADLNDITPLDAGKTEVDGKTVLNWSTDLEAIGESYTIWATKGGAQNNDTVIYADNTGLNTIETFTAKADLKREIKMKTNDDTEKFLNFGDEATYTADRLVTYDKLTKIDFANKGTNTLYVINKNGAIVESTDASAVEGTTYYTKSTVSVKAGDPLDMDAIATVFDYNELSIYVGTKGSSNYVDQSDELSYRQFVSKYVTASSDAAVTANENGNYVKVIDNDGDGVADYILKTQYAVATVEKVAKNGAVTLSAAEQAETYNNVNTITKDVKVSAYDDVAVGDVVIYAVIDGIAYADKAESVEIVVDKQNLNKITITSTDGDTYEQSAIDYMVDDNQFVQDIMDLQKDYTYIAYKDKAGYIATATQATQAGEFVLLTDAYYATTKAGADYAVKGYVDGEIGSYDVNARSTANFIAKGSDNNNWGKLNKFQCKSEDTETHLTNVATYTLDDDGVMSLNVVEKAFNKKVVNMIDLDVVTLNGTNKKLSGANYYTASTDTTPYATKDEDSQTVNVRSDTVYYYVSKDAVTDTITVKSYTGYANAPQVAAADINNMYAVATYVTSSDYWVANVVVVELKDSYKGSAESVFVYNYPENVNTLRNATIDIIKADGTTASVNVANPSEITYGPAYLYGNATDGYAIKKMDTTTSLTTSCWPARSPPRLRSRSLTMLASPACMTTAIRMPPRLVWATPAVSTTPTASPTTASTMLVAWSSLMPTLCWSPRSM
jgi:hypothetical protein